MSDSSVQKLAPKKEWPLTAPAFRRLLAWLDESSGSEGQTYLEMRRRLVAYFDRKACSAPDELADETLNRVARRLEEEGKIESETPAKYCYIVARFVFMEHLRETQKGTVVLDEIRRQKHGGDAVEVDDNKEKMLDCLGQCTSKLESVSRELITRYYVGKERVKIENRRALAEGLGITVNALAIRACRIRDKLEACVRQCANETK
jgi:DNA-directed RNA polymerase specialized sigma24 family protein